MSKIKSYLSTILVVLVFIQLAPTLIKNINANYKSLFGLTTQVGKLKIKDAIGDISNYSKNLKNFFEKSDIKAIFIEIESPGGTAGASKALFDEILSLKKEYPKPVVILSNDLCASGAYYIACAGDHIVSSSSAIIGSIGSYIGSFKLKDLIESMKVEYNIKQSGKYKTALNPFTKITPEQNEFLQAISDDVYDQFKRDVATRRNLSLDTADTWANGKFFSGKQALALGLVDEVGSEYNAIKKIRELAKIDKDKKIEWVKSESPSAFEQLLGKDDSSSNSLLDIIANKIFAKLGISADNKIMMQ